METLIDVPNGTWGRVKNFGTVKDLSPNTAVDYLLDHALTEHGFPKIDVVTSDEIEASAR
jgi:hypothetical protein